MTTLLFILCDVAAMLTIVPCVYVWRFLCFAFSSLWHLAIQETGNLVAGYRR